MKAASFCGMPIPVMIPTTVWAIPAASRFLEYSQKSIPRAAKEGRSLMKEVVITIFCSFVISTARTGLGNETREPVSMS